jgi:peptidoglycan-associated lipoprotein
LATKPAPEPAPELQPAPTERLAPAVTERAPQLAPAELVVSFPGTATATLTEEALAELQALAAHLREHPNQHLRVVGHADARGPRGFNRYLGIRRARAVTEVLLSAGVARRQIEALSRGEDDPRVTGESETAWAANRRVEISGGSERRNGS